MTQEPPNLANLDLMVATRPDVATGASQLDQLKL